MKKIDFNLTVAELVKDNPEVRKILSALGMGKLITPEALQVMGNIMTIPRAAVIQGVALADVVQAFTDAGFAVVNGEPSPAENLTCQLTSQIDRSIGLPAGHPVSLLRAENAGLGAVLDSIAAQLSGRGVPDAAIVIKALQDFNGVRAHYAKKEELLMAQLYKYGVTGPSQVMWDEDDEIKKELGTLTRAVMDDADNVLIYKGRIAALVEKARGMMAKEEKILFPLCLRFFTAEEWKKIYRDFPEMGMAFVEKPAKWEEGENWAADELAKVKGQDILAGKILLPTGELTVKQLSALLSLLPLDLTFIDAEEKLRFFINEGRVFPRPLAALGRDVAECHPPHIVPVVRNLVADFKAKKRSSLEVARYIMGKPILVKYMAVYDDDGEYLGTLEAVQNCEHILEKFGQQ
ncbi:MAG: PAS domain-containing protein [Selenomonas sp.]|nr:PAS domain-containing protein [Selenomonas sp.]